MDWCESLPLPLGSPAEADHPQVARLTAPLFGKGPVALRPRLSTGLPFVVRKHLLARFVSPPTTPRLSENPT